MDKIKTVKIKNPNGSVSEETYTIAVDAKNVDMENGKDLQDTIGTIDIDNDGDISNQLKNLKNNKINMTDIIDNLDSSSNTKVLSAKQGKVLGDAVTILKTESAKKKPYYYNSVADMKADKKLKVGDMAVTLGYYETNDGGGATYKVTLEKSENDYQEELNNQLFTTLIIDDIANIKKFGAKPNDNTFNNTEIIQYCLNNYNNIFIPEGNFYTNPLFMKSYTNLFGTGKKSVLIPIGTSENGLINIKDNNIKTTVKNIKLQGNNIIIDAIKITRLNQTAIDSNEIFENINIELFNGKGFNLNSTYIRSLFIIGCNISNCESDGIYLNGTDNFIDNTICYWNKGNGIYIKDGSSNKIINSKCFGNSENGLFINGSATQVSNFESQDNYKCGLYNYQSWGNEYNNVCISTNGLKTTDGSNYSNINFTNSYDCYVNGTVLNRRTAQSTIIHSKYGCEVNNSTNINIDLKQHLLNIDLIPFKYENLNVSNKININNINYSLKNIYEDKNIGTIGNIPNLSHIFTSVNIRANSDGSISCSEIEQAQNIEIGNNSTTDLTSAVSVYGEVDFTGHTETNVSLYVSGSNNKLQTESQVSGVITFLNSGGGQISQTTDVYGQNGFTVNSVIPENTAKIRYTITYLPRIQNLQGKFSITDVKLSLF